MTEFDRRDANMKMLQETNQVQDKTKEAILRMQRQTAEAEEIGGKTLEELRRQGQQMDDIHNELASVNSKLDQSQALQSRFDRWAGNWLGGKKRAALKEAAAEITDRSLNTEYSKVKEVFQHEKYDSITRTWKRAGLVLCTDPTVSCDDVFDPAIQETMEKSSWQIDFALSGIDPEGWTYAYDFATLNKTGSGDTKPQWNSYVRRRKWRYQEQKSSTSGAMDEIQQRQDERKNKASASASEKLKQNGYVPRNKQMTASGLTSQGMTAGKGKAAKDQELDEESAAGLKQVQQNDAEINAGLNSIDNSLDRLNLLAGTMRDEVYTHNEKLERLDNSMGKTMEKQTVVNARQRYLLK